MNIPFLKVGRQRKFKVTEVDDWIRSGKAADKPNADDENETQTEED
jgi:hypothetical protein